MTKVDRLTAAIECLAEESFHIVFLDLGLPDSRGLATLSSLAKRASNVPVIVLSNNDNDELAV